MLKKYYSFLLPFLLIFLLLFSLFFPSLFHPSLSSLACSVSFSPSFSSSQPDFHPSSYFPLSFPPSYLENDGVKFEYKQTLFFFRIQWIQGVNSGWICVTFFLIFWSYSSGIKTFLNIPRTVSNIAYYRQWHALSNSSLLKINAVAFVKA